MREKCYTNLLERREIARRRLNRVADELLFINSQITLVGSDKCWSCEKTGDTTDLTMCEIGNNNYPKSCKEYKPK